MASRNSWLEYQGKRVAQRERSQSDLNDMNYEGTMAKAPPCPERRMRTPLPQQSSSSIMEEESPWSAQERTEQYVNNSECIQLGIDEVEACSLGPEYADIDVKQILRKATREGRNIFEVFKVKEEGEQLAASK